MPSITPMSPPESENCFRHDTKLIPIDINLLPSVDRPRYFPFVLTTSPFFLLASLALGFVLLSCGTPSPPQCRFVPLISRGNAGAQLEQARTAWQAFARSNSAADLELYNRALAPLIDRVRCGSGTFAERAVKLGTSFAEIELREAKANLEALDSLITAESVSIKAVGTRHTDPGLGVPMVGWISEPEDESRLYEFAPPTGAPLNLTLWLDFDAAVPTWRMVYPGRVPTATVSGRVERLAADWSAANAFYWRMTNLDDLDIAKVILPTRYAKDTDIYLAEPYDPTKIPVLFVHGLNSSPGTWATLYNDLHRYQWFRENYQAWFFSYPTGTSWVYNAARFRDKMLEAGKLARSGGGSATWNDMVVVAHSMGGVISHANLVKPGLRFYDADFDKPLDQLSVTSSARRAIEWLLLYEPLEAPSRVVFMATPHQGAPLATRWLPALFSNLIRLPKTITIDLLEVTLSEIGTALKDGGDERPLQTSIGTLSPNFNGFEAMKLSPWRPNLIRHSIIGDRGCNDGVNGSDGIVPYWSAHLAPVASELVVPSSHGVTDDPDAMAEVTRILKLHLK